jgi:hypothetical protein
MTKDCFGWEAVVGPGPGRQTKGRESWVAVEPSALAEALPEVRRHEAALERMR